MNFTHLFRKPWRHEWHLKCIAVRVQCIEWIWWNGAQHRKNATRKLIANCAEEEKRKVERFIQSVTKLNIFLRTSKFQRVPHPSDFLTCEFANFVAASIIPFYSLFVMADTSASVLRLLAFANKYTKYAHVTRCNWHKRGRTSCSMSICIPHVGLIWKPLCTSRNFIRRNGFSSFRLVRRRCRRCRRHFIALL